MPATVRKLICGFSFELEGPGLKIRIFRIAGFYSGFGFRGLYTTPRTPHGTEAGCAQKYRCPLGPHFML